MQKQGDLLPWILAGVSAATIAVAFTAVSARREAAPLAPTSTIPALPASRPSVSVPQSPAPSAAQTPIASDSAGSAPPPAQTAVESEVHASQIWECSTNGVKTFSNNPCGEKSTLLEVGPINTMNAAPAIHDSHAYGYEPRYAPSYADGRASADQEHYSDDNGVEAASNSYTIVQGPRFVARRRPEHLHRPSPHDDPVHASGPVRRY